MSRSDETPPDNAGGERLTDLTAFVIGSSLVYAIVLIGALLCWKYG